MSTLKAYLGKDLAKATAMATVAITLVITVFAVIEPLREQGMSGIQALKFFGYIMPVMFSLTLPIAALFAATIVYGRFSRDNELMACRASGIASLSLLTPAMWLGGIVSVITLTLGLYIAPKLMFISEASIKKNLQQIVYHRLKKKQYFDFSKRIFHADQVNPGDEQLKGVVVVDYSKPDNVKCMVAAGARLEFEEEDNETFVKFYPIDPTLLSQRGGGVLSSDAAQLRRGDFPSMKDEPKFYDWTRLRHTLANPETCPSVGKEIVKIKRQMCVQNFYEDVIRQIKSTGKYESLHGYKTASTEVKPERIVIEASEASLHKEQEVHLRTSTPQSESAGSSTPPFQRDAVLVRQYAGETLKRQLWAKDVRIRGKWDKDVKATLVTVTLNNATVLPVGEQIENVYHRKKVEISSLVVPKEIVARSRQVDSKDLFRNASDYTDSPQVLKMIKGVHESMIPRLRSKICAEMHQRLAYGIGCLLMVMLGAALGLLFRGGEALIAFAISAGPASAMIVMMLMGKQLISNPGVPESYGIAVIWGGIAAMFGATVYIYSVTMRR